VTAAAVLAAGGFPNPVGWAADQVKGLVGGAAAQGFGLIIGGLSKWVLDAVVWVVGGVFNFFLGATDPNVQADWFIRGHGPYATTVGIAATLLVGFVLIGITQGVLTGDVAGMLRRITFELPVAVLAMVGLITVTQALIRLTDELSRGLLKQFGDDVQHFTAGVNSVSALGGPTTSSFVVVVLALVSVLAGVVLVAELVVRSALIYIVVALAPLVFAAQLWPALRGVARKLLELLVALIVSKLVVAIALAVAAAAAVGAGAGAGGQVSSLSPPEVLAHSPGGSITQAVGILLAATAAFGVAAFSPLLIARLLPLTEAALVASGIRGGPVRAGQQAMSASYYAQAAGRSRLGALASGRAGGQVGSGAAGAAGGAATGGAVAAGAIAAKAVAGAAGSGARAATASVDDVASRRPDGSAAGRPPRPTRRPPPGAEGEGDGGRT